MSDFALFAAVFLACLVEAVEATTIVIAAGSARNWHSALTGTVAAIVVLAVAVAVFGPAIQLLPIAVLRIVIGGLLLVFGLQWLRKAVLRASGVKALHDEDKIFRREVAEAKAAKAEHRFGVADWYAFTLSFKGVLLEGLEVVFIVLTFATNQGNLPVAIVAAAAAAVLVTILGFVVRGPLARVPENTLKFVVGVMLTSFGLFWGAEGVGAVWPGADAALLVIAPAVAVFCLLLAALFARRRASRQPSAPTPAPVKVAVGGAGAAAAEAVPPAAVPGPARPSRLAAFGLFWYDFIVGDDWQVALGVAIALAVVAVASAWSGSWLIAVVAVAVLIPFGTVRAARR
ncbi:hypothetical protein [Gryllotalpicola sp.]|uniref:COG4280 domain-containing protein n=1 Tax=Gryllotalpicola sp. TaxID=1932787 RepID=UPI00262E8458|nr:hypothetical protein [Gryllotalpicola sp.]